MLAKQDLLLAKRNAQVKCLKVKSRYWKKKANEAILDGGKRRKNSAKQSPRSRNNLDKPSERVAVPQAVKKAIQGDVKKVLLDFFTPAQVKCFMAGKWKRAGRWSHKDIQVGLTLHLLGRRAYNQLRKRRILPLPCTSTLQKYFRHFQIR